jgi:hypothetical protein
MKNWAKQLAGAVLVLVFALAVGGFVMILRAQQNGLAATMAAANVRAVSPADGAINVPLSGELRADYVSRPQQDPIIKFEPPVGVTLDAARWDGTTFVLHYSGLGANRLYHVELDQDTWTGKGEHKQVKVRWSFRTGSGTPQRQRRGQPAPPRRPRRHRSHHRSRPLTRSRSSGTADLPMICTAWIGPESRSKR